MITITIIIVIIIIIIIVIINIIIFMNRISIIISGIITDVTTARRRPGQGSGPLLEPAGAPWGDRSNRSYSI